MIALSARTASLAVILTCIVVIVRNVADFHTSTSRAAAGSLASSSTAASSTSSSSSGRLRSLLRDERQIRTLAGSLFASDNFRRAWHREHELAHIRELHAIGRAATSHRSLQAATTLHGCKCKTA